MNNKMKRRKRKEESVKSFLTNAKEMYLLLMIQQKQLKFWKCIRK